jgi:CelD/BcsL family acetyltransferase involved in cellulose biosynthesis
VLAGSKRADNFRRKLKKLEKMPGFEFRSVTSPEETPAAFRRFARLHEKRWEQDGGSELTGHARLMDFQRRLMPGLSRASLIRFDELWIDGECRSSVYGLDNGHTFYYYNSGYDLDYSHLSVGLVLLGLSVKHAIGRGALDYDFLRGDETYKFDWATHSTDLVSLTFSRNTLPAIAHEMIGKAWSKTRDLAKSALPGTAGDALANLRRAWRRKHQFSDR